MPLSLRLRSPTTLPIDGDSIRPDALRGFSPSEVAKLGICVGNRRVEAGEIFEIGGDSGDESIVIEGDLSHVHRLGAMMMSGTLRVVGDVGMHLAAGMSGGSVFVEGAAGDWAGAEMKGGSIAIRGNAGDGLGSAYPGSRSGMKEGFIHVEGDAGEDVGLAMRRGLIVVGGENRRRTRPGDDRRLDLRLRSGRQTAGGGDEAGDDRDLRRNLRPPPDLRPERPVSAAIPDDLSPMAP